MKIKLVITWDSIRSSYWFLPCLMVGAAVLLSISAIAIDFALPKKHNHVTWLYSGDAEGARTLLATLAASMITIFGVVFSIVIVALTLASSQFGPRLLRTFLRDRVDQVAVGTFISTFVYCVLVLRVVKAYVSEPFVLDISVSTAILLALFSLGVLIYFINHLSASLQASHIIARVGADLDATIDTEFELPAERAENDPASAVAAEVFASANIAVCATRHGYIQAVDYAALVRIAEREETPRFAASCSGKRR